VIIGDTYHRLAPMAIHIQPIKGWYWKDKSIRMKLKHHFPEYILKKLDL
jgi:hypothetical protein